LAGCLCLHKISQDNGIFLQKGLFTIENTHMLQVVTVVIIIIIITTTNTTTTTTTTTTKFMRIYCPEVRII